MKLRDYQVKGVEFGYKVKHPYYACDLGTGKTAIALSLIKKIGEPALVLAPLRPLYSTWPDEIKKWAPDMSYYIMHGSEKSVKEAVKHDIILLNYEGLKWFSEQRGKWKPRTLVLDESSMVKAHDTKRFAFLKKADILWNGYKMCLSATPAPNSLADLWPQYFLLDRGRALGSNISEFRRRYCYSFSYPGLPFTQYNIDPARATDIYDAIAPITFRLDVNDYLELPEITYNTISCDLSSTLQAQYKKLEKDFFIELEDAEVAAFSTVTLGMKLRQFIQGGLYDENKKWHDIHRIKANTLKELVDTAAGNPILCAIQFKGELEILRGLFPSVPVIAGGTNAKLATQYIDQWNNGELPLLLCHPASISHGVNLQFGGHILVWYGLTWSLEQYQQLIGRLYRFGQTANVIIHHILMRGTIDEAVMRAIESKDYSQRTLLNYLNEYKHLHF